MSTFSTELTDLAQAATQLASAGIDGDGDGEPDCCSTLGSVMVQACKADKARCAGSPTVRPCPPSPRAAHGQPRVRRGFHSFRTVSAKHVRVSQRGVPPRGPVIKQYSDI